MITNKEYESLYELLNAKEDYLEKLYERFVKAWGSESASLFRPCFSIANFLSLNLLTRLQRIVAMFILLETFKAEGIRKNPFAGTLFDVYDKTSQPYERKFLCEMLLDNRRDRYAKLKLQVINEEYEQLQEPYKLRDEMETLRKGFIENVPKVVKVQTQVTASKQNEVRNVVPNFGLKERKAVPPDQPVNKDSIRENELAYEAYSSNFLLPLPKFIEISPTELQWLGPGIIYDVAWDSTYEKEKKYARTRHLLGKSESTPLTQDQSRELIKLCEDYPYLIEAELNINSIEGITSTNPSVALELLTCTYDSRRFQSIVEKLLNMKVNRNTISIVGRFFLKFDVPKVLVCFYITRMIQQCNPSDPNVQRTVGLVTSFTEMCLRNKMLDLKMIEQYIKEFVLKFPKNDRLVSLCKHIEECEQ